MRKVCAMFILYAHIYARILCAYIHTHTLRIYTHAYLAHIYTRILCAYPRILCKHIRACYAPNAWSTSIYYARMCAIVHTLIWAQYIHAYPRIPSQIMHWIKSIDICNQFMRLEVESWDEFLLNFEILSIYDVRKWYCCDISWVFYTQWKVILGTEVRRQGRLKDPYSLQLSTNLAGLINQLIAHINAYLWKLMHNCAYQRILVKVDAQLRISTLNCAYIRIITDGYHHMAVSVWHQKSGMRWNLSPTPQSYKIS